MNGASHIGCALLILLLLPVLILHMEGRSVADRYHGLIALCGIGFAAWAHGPGGALWAVVSGLGCLLMLSAAVAAISALWRLHLLTGGHIKLLAAGACWLSVMNALLMLALAATLFWITALFLRARKAADPRPDMAAITAIALLSVQLMA